MFEFRVTKYDPAHRNSVGSYTRDDWTSVGDIGRPFSGSVLTQSEYQRVEDAYAVVAVAFLQEAGSPNLSVAGLENQKNAQILFADGASLSLEEIGLVIRRVLREEFWCRLEGVAAFVHLGYDYYMYVGVPQPCPAAEALAQRLGLFVEPIHSPYSERSHA
jgi:hypothetical protein